MLNKYLNRLKNFFKKKFDDNLILNANTYFKLARGNYNNIKNLKDVEFKVYSQNGEDGIIDYLINVLNIKNIKFVEIGVGDYTECNTRFLTNNFPFKGLVCDFNSRLKQNLKLLVSTHRGDIQIYNEFIYQENIIEILKKYNFFENINLCSLDIDGNDYFILRRLPINFSDIFIAEYNQNFGSKLEVTTPYMKNFNRFDYHYSGLCWGVSIKALIKLMDKKDYLFLGTNSECCNAFFIKKSLSSKFDNAVIQNYDIKDATNDYICDAREKNGNLIYLPIKERLKVIKNCDVIDLSVDGSENNVKISDLLTE